MANKKVKQENDKAKSKTYEQGFIDGKKAEKRRVIRLLKKHDLWHPPKKNE